MAPQESPHIPQDVCDCIIDMLAPDTAWTDESCMLDFLQSQGGSNAYNWFKAPPTRQWQTDALEACTLVCHDWLPHSSFHIFGKVIVIDENRFLRRVCDTPRIARNLRMLSFSSGSSSRGVEGDTVVKILSLLPNLQTLSMSVPSTLPSQTVTSTVPRHLDKLRLDSMQWESARSYLSLFCAVNELYLRAIQHDETSAASNVEEREGTSAAVAIASLTIWDYSDATLTGLQEMISANCIRDASFDSYPPQQFFRSFGQERAFLSLDMGNFSDEDDCGACCDSCHC